MAITGSIDSSDRALQASSGNLGEILRTGAGIPKRSQSLLQQKNIQAVDKESPVGHKPLRPIQQRRHTKRASGQPATTYRCEFNSPRYVEYREKQKKQKNGKGRPQPWPDHVEEAFHDALRHIKKNTGRRRRIYNGRDMGTNELISEFIFQRTGVDRDRKMVSSHLQVLKPFMTDNPEWMAFVTPDPGDSQDVEHMSIAPFNESEEEDEEEDQKPYPCLNTLPPPSGIVPSSRKSSIRRIHFEMYILGPELEKLHVYTSLQSENGSAAKRLEDIPEWQQRFPRISSHYDQGSLHEDIILFDTSFKLMNSYPPIKMMGCQPPLRSKLGVDFDVVFNQGSEFINWECQSNFYEQGVLKESIGTSTTSESLPSGDAKVVVLHPSQWWVGLFTDIIKERLKKEQEGDLDAMQQDAERARSLIQDITAVQEIWATSKASGAQMQRMAIFLWNFRQCQDHETPTTTWRKVIPPSTKTEPYSPIQISAPLLHQASMIDTVAEHHNDLFKSVPLYAEYFDPQPFLGDCSENLLAGFHSRLRSPSLVAIADSQSSRSFPSSTSDSFDSSVRNSLFPVETPPDSSFGSQTSMLHPEVNAYSLQEMGYDPQDPIYPSHELECPSEETLTRSSHASLFCPHDSIESSHASQEYYYHMQETMAHSHGAEHPPSVSQGEPDYAYHHLIPDPGNRSISPPIEDFTGMHIQLSYAAPEEAMSNYGTPYIVSPNNMEAPPENNLVGYDPQSQNVVPDHDDAQYQEPLDLEQWQAMDQAVRWANAQFSNGEYEEVGDLLKNNEPALGDVDDLQSGIDVVGMQVL